MVHPRKLEVLFLNQRLGRVVLMHLQQIVAVIRFAPQRRVLSSLLPRGGDEDVVGASQRDDEEKSDEDEASVGETAKARRRLQAPPQQHL
jgi:hypothetical protein